MMGSLHVASLVRASPTPVRSANQFIHRRTRVCDSSDALFDFRRFASSNATSQTLVEKIVQKFAVGLPQGHVVKSGDYLSVSPHHIMTHDNTGAVILKFNPFFNGKSSGAKVYNPRQPVFTLDHNVQDKSESNLKKYRQIEEFAKKHQIDFYPAGRGIGHQVMCEEGYAWPLTMVVASDSHSNMYGGLGCLGTPIVRTDAAAIWATGKTWWQVPPVTKVELTGRLAEGVSGKDVIITLCGLFNKDEVLNHAVEFTGDGIKSLSIEDRLTIANMTTEWGTLAGIFNVDEKTIDWFYKRAKFLKESRGKEHPRINQKTAKELESNVFSSDSKAVYAQELTLDLASVRPHVSGPNHVKVMSSVSDMEQKNVKINKAYIVSCVNSRVNDLAEAAKVLKGKKIAEGVELYISAASSEVQQESEKKGDWQALVEAGAKPLLPGCGPCIGLGVGLLQDGEVGISATNRNFKGRMGSPSAIAYLASPSVVAASAAAGYIKSPHSYTTSKPVGSVKAVNDTLSGNTSEVPLTEGFPAVIKGEAVFCHQDNLNTDGIYPGKYTYKDDISPSQQAEVVMENYDPEFVKIVKKGSVLVGGFNFGTGSSREQAATALKYKGIPVVLAGSFSETFKRNAINNGYLVIEVPQLVKDLKQRFGTNKLTVLTGLETSIDFKKAVITFDGKTYPMSPVGSVAQELILEEGLENWVVKRLPA